MKLRKVKTLIDHVSQFAEKGKGEAAILRDPGCRGSSRADGSFHLDAVRQDSQGEAQDVLP